MPRKERGTRIINHEKVIKFEQRRRFHASCCRSRWSLKTPRKWAAYRVLKHAEHVEKLVVPGRSFIQLTAGAAEVTIYATRGTKYGPDELLEWGSTPGDACHMTVPICR